MSKIREQLNEHLEVIREETVKVAAVEKEMSGNIVQVKVFKDVNKAGAFLAKQSNEWKEIVASRTHTIPTKSGKYKTRVTKKDGKSVVEYIKV